MNLESLRKDLAGSTLCSDSHNNQHIDLDDLVQNYNNTLSEVMNRHAPLKTKNMVVRPTVPWYNDNINAAKRLRRKAQRKWRRTKSDIDYIEFKTKKTMLPIL